MTVPATTNEKKMSIFFFKFKAEKLQPVRVWLFLLGMRYSAARIPSSLLLLHFMPLLTSLLTDSSQQSFQPSNPRSQVSSLQQPPLRDHLSRSVSVCAAEVNRKLILWRINKCSVGLLYLEL